jgi:hypothetical protein
MARTRSSTRRFLEGREPPKCDVRCRDPLCPLDVDPRHSIARNQRPIRVRPKSTRDYSRSAATMMSAPKQLRSRAVHFGGYVALAPL